MMSEYENSNRAGVFWVMDIFTPNVVGYNGMRYVNVIGDVGSGFADVMHLEHKSDLTEEFIKFVKNIRAMYGKDHDYELCQRVQGFMVKGVHYTDTFAAAPDVTVSRTLQALACGLGWERRTYDVSTAYLQADPYKYIARGW